MNVIFEPMKRCISTSLCMLVALLSFASVANAERKTTYYHTDGLGSVVAASDQSGALLWRKEYAPFGQQIDATAENEKIAYTGKEHDDDTGLTYFGARHYDPYLGRFTSVDPVGFMESNPMSFNRYAYGNSNPYKYVDPDGRLPILIPIAIFIAKEAAAEVASRATGGATDFLSVRRMGTKGAKFALKTMSQHVDAADVSKAANPTDIVKEISVSRAKYGEGADHIADAQKAGHPDVLTIARGGAPANRNASIGGIAKVPNKQLDEYPPAMFKEGGAGASVRAISPSKNMGAGACIGNACRGLSDGAKVRIKVVD